MARFLVLTSMFPPHHYGGYELQCRDVIRRWRRDGHSVTVLCSDHRRADATHVADEGDVRRLLKWYWRDHEIIRPSLPRRLAFERHNRSVLEAVLTQVRPDVVSVWQMGAMSLGLLQQILGSGRPMTCVINDDWLVYGPIVDGWTRLFRRQPAFGAVAQRVTGLPTAMPDLARDATLCFVSEATRKRAEEATGWDLSRSQVVPSGIDTDDFPVEGRKPGEWRWRLYLPGRIDPRKGIATAIKAMIDLPPVTHLRVEGSGNEPHLAELRRLADELGVARRVDFTTAERHEMRRHYRAADACVFPPTWDEPFGLVPLEAMACGTPVVATGTGGSAEFLVDGENCLLFERHDAEGLAAALHRLAGDAGLRQRLVDGGLATAARFTVDGVASHLLEIHLRGERPRPDPGWRSGPER